MTRSVSINRWHDAQAAERSYWRVLGSDPIECARVPAGKVGVVARFQRRFPVATGFGALASHRVSRLPLSEVIGHAHRLVSVAEKLSTPVAGKP